MFPKHVIYLFLTTLWTILLGVIFAIAVPNAIGETTQPSGTTRILNSGEIRVGVRRDLGPYGFLHESGDCCDGFDADIAKEFADRWKKTLTPVPIQASERISLLVSGDLDLVIGAMTHTKARDEQIDFSQSYFLDGLQLLVNKGSTIQDLDDLGGLLVGVVGSTTGRDWASERAIQYNYTLVTPFSSYDEAIAALMNGGIDALISDGGALQFRAQQHPDQLMVVGGPYTQEFYGIGVPQGDSPLRELVNYTLQAMKEDGTYDSIYRKWFGDKESFPIEVLPGEKPQRLEDYQVGISRLEGSDVDKIVQTQRVIIGVPAAAGLQVDIAREFAYRWLGDITALDLRTVTTQTGIAALADDSIDLWIDTLLPTWQTGQVIDFSQTYAIAHAHLAVINALTEADSLASLSGQLVAVVVNTSYQQWIKSEGVRYAIQIKSFDNYDDAFAALALNEVVAVVGSQEELDFRIAQNTAWKSSSISYTIPYAIGIPDGDFRLRELVNFTLQTMKEDGFYDCLYKKWLPNDIPYPVEQLQISENYLPLRYENNEEGRTCVPKSTIQRIQERDKSEVVVGVLDNFAPMGFLNDSSEWVGFDLDLVKALANLWGVEVQFTKVLASQRVPLLVSGEVDLIAGAMTHTRDRDVLIDFSQNYFMDGQSLLVSKGSGITGPRDLDQKRVGAIEGTTGIAGITAFRDNQSMKFEIVPFPEDPAAVEALENGSVDAFTTDRIALLQFAERYPSLMVVGDLFSSEPYGLGLQAGDSQFRHLVDCSLQELARNGQYKEIYARWFPDLPVYPIEILPEGDEPCVFQIDTLLGEPIDPPVTPVIEKMRSGAPLVAGVLDGVAPFGALDDKGQCCIGFDVDLIKEFAKRWLGDDSERSLTLQPIKLEQRISALANHEVDIVAAQMTHTWKREKQIDFSQTYFFDRQGLLVNKDSNIAGMVDLKGKRVAAILGTTSIDQIQKYKDEIGFEVISFQDQVAALDALIRKQVEAYTIDRITLQNLAEDNSGLVVVGEPFSDEPYGIGVSENDHQFRDLVNSTLQEMILDGTYDRLYQKWFGTAPELELEIWPRLIYTGYLGFSQTPMVYIPEGEFLRGNENGKSEEKPAKIIFLDAYYIDQYEVTNRLYRECVAAERCTPPQKPYSLEERGDYYNNVIDYGNFPVIWITWEQANQYCQFQGKRLPTEAQWEKAARGPQNYSYPWGNELLQAVQANFASNKDSTGVGIYPIDISGYQVYDMAGNVREWVNDFYDPNYYKQENPRNPIGPRKAVRKVVRGGSWIASQSNLWRVTSREGYNHNNPASYAGNLGFRCVASQAPIQLVRAN